MILPGDTVPFCYGMAPDRSFYSFQEQAGRAAVLVIGGRLGPAEWGPILGRLAEGAAMLAARQTDLRLMVAASPAALGAGMAALPPGAQVVFGNADFLEAFQPLDVVLIDRAARLVARWEEHAGLAAAVQAAVAALPQEAACDIPLPAPVLMIPGLLDPALCRMLIARFETGISFDSGVAGATRDGSAADRVDHRKKQRRDCMLEPGDGLCEAVLGLLARRCAPAVNAAFQHQVTRIDRMLVARYDETGGYFRRHRDNASERMAFRQFALSVNLNTGAYEGGHLLFPEYNDHRYAPPVGGGLVFSASLLHEAAPVTRGSRYVLLTFLYDEAGEAQRLAYMERAATAPATGPAAGARPQVKGR